MKKLVLWDLGHVWFSVKWHKSLKQQAKLFAATLQELREFLEVRENLCGQNSWEKYESGYSEEGIYLDYINYFGNKNEVNFENFRRVFNIGISYGTTYPQLVDIAEKLKAQGVTQGILSNINSIHAEYLERFAREANSYPHKIIPKELTFYSCEINQRKDLGPQAFLHCCEKSEVEPKNAVLIDGRPENIRGSICGGGKGILYINPQYTEERLRQLEFLK